MTMLLAFYLGGWFATSSVLISRDCSEPQRHMSQTECKVLYVAGGAVWPVVFFAK